MRLRRWVRAVGQAARILLLAVIAGSVAVPAAAVHVRREAAARLAFRIWRQVSAEAHGGRFVEVDGVRLYCETYGAGSPVLVLHGGLGSLEDMHSQIRALAAERLVIAADSRGHGRSSDANTSLSYRLMADDMVRLLDALHVGRVDVVGWSDGGIIGLDLAMRYPERVRRLVVIGANFDPDGLTWLPAASGPVAPVPAEYASDAPDPAHWPALYRKVMAMWRSEPRYSPSDLGRIAAPTLVLAGEFDVIRRAHTDALAHAIPGAEEAVIDGAGHGVALEKPGFVDALILAFLNGDDAA